MGIQCACFKQRMRAHTHSHIYKCNRFEAYFFTIHEESINRWQDLKCLKIVLRQSSGWCCGDGVGGGGGGDGSRNDSFSHRKISIVALALTHANTHTHYICFCESTWAFWIFHSTAFMRIFATIASVVLIFFMMWLYVAGILFIQIKKIGEKEERVKQNGEYGCYFRFVRSHFFGYARDPICWCIGSEVGAHTSKAIFSLSLPPTSSLSLSLLKIHV